MSFVQTGSIIKGHHNPILSQKFKLSTPGAHEFLKEMVDFQNSSGRRVSLS